MFIVFINVTIHRSTRSRQREKKSKILFSQKDVEDGKTIQRVRLIFKNFRSIKSFLFLEELVVLFLYPSLALQRWAKMSQGFFISLFQIFVHLRFYFSFLSIQTNVNKYKRIVINKYCHLFLSNKFLLKESIKIKCMFVFSCV